MKLAVVGAGWAGLACAIEATRAGHAVTLFEAARTPGGRARRIDATGGVDGTPLDNGQHILIGAYTATLALMRDVGVDTTQALYRMPLSLRFADGGGLQVPVHWPAPFDLLAGIVGAGGWSWRDKLGLMRAAWRWRRQRFACASGLSVDALCRTLTPRVRHELIEPLCVSALNTPAEDASAQVFLRVLQDALFAGRGGADLLLPRVDLGALLPDPALRWLHANGATLRLGHRVQSLAASDGGWRLDDFDADRVVLAVAPWDAVRLVHGAGLRQASTASDWLRTTDALRHESIATVYVSAGARQLATPMLALRSDAAAPAQFVFDRGQLGGARGLLAFVVSASNLPREALEHGVLEQAHAQLGLRNVEVLRTVVEKRATFACTPGLRRPAMQIADGLLACGDYIDGPYPATLEGAVRSGLAAARAIAP
ncbi:MAG: hydroxysqualene dehydroxylase HpnE [Pseudomonadota bacterium]